MGNLQAVTPPGSTCASGAQPGSRRRPPHPISPPMRSDLITASVPGRLHPSPGPAVLRCPGVHEGGQPASAARYRGSGHLPSARPTVKPLLGACRLSPGRAHSTTVRLHAGAQEAGAAGFQRRGPRLGSGCRRAGGASARKGWGRRWARGRRGTREGRGLGEASRPRRFGHSQGGGLEAGPQASDCSEVVE